MRPMNLNVDLHRDGPAEYLHVRTDTSEALFRFEGDRFAPRARDGEIVPPLPDTPTRLTVKRIVREVLDRLQRRAIENPRRWTRPEAYEEAIFGLYRAFVVYRAYLHRAGVKPERAGTVRMDPEECPFLNAITAAIRAAVEPDDLRATEAALSALRWTEAAEGKTIVPSAYRVIESGRE